MNKVDHALDRKNHIYIAGPMTGIDDWNFPAFNAAAEYLTDLGFTAHNPANHGLIAGATRSDYLRYDLREISQCEGIYLLNGWSSSEGALFEVQVAKMLDMKIFYAAGAERSLLPIGGTVL